MSEHIYGPVPSRRLGRSLGVDLVPFKTCTYDCIYCQLGRTTCKTLERKEWVPLDELLQELESRIASRPEYITLSGSGEPTLYARTGELIERIKSMTDIPVAVLTNGSLLWQEDIRAQLMKADVIIPSLDAGSEEMYLKVNRPHRGITFERMLNGLVDFQREFEGEYRLELFLVEGYTSKEAQVSMLAKWVERIRPDRLQLNTVSRPPAETKALSVSHERMAELVSMFDPPGEIIADFRQVRHKQEFHAGVEEVLGMLRRRPCTLDDIIRGLGIHRMEILKYMEILAGENAIETTTISGVEYYRARRPGKT